MISVIFPLKRVQVRMEWAHLNNVFTQDVVAD